VVVFVWGVVVFACSEEVVKVVLKKDVRVVLVKVMKVVIEGLVRVVLVEIE